MLTCASERIPMGFLDDLTETLNRGASVTAKTANVLKLKAQIADLNNQRRNLCAGLGAALNDRTKGDVAFTDGLEDFYNGIENCDQRIADLQHQVDRVEKEGPARANAKSKWMKTCATCGYSIGASDMFCSRCGTPVPREDVETSYDGDCGTWGGSSPDGAEIPKPSVNHEPIDVNPC